MSLIFGAHVSIAKGFSAAAVKTADEYGANAMQIFTKNPRGRGAKPIFKKDSEAFKKICKEKKIRFVVAHCSYLLNFAKPLPQNHWSIKDIILDLERIHTLGGVGVILHVGKTLELEYNKAFTYLVQNLTIVLEKTKTLNNVLILENTAGQGSEMGFSFEQLAELYRALKKSKRITFCLDTQHSFAAGYDWRKKNGTRDIFCAFDKLIGLKNLSCIHFNDAMKAYNTRVDRHQNIGKGYIGEVPLQNIARFAVKQSIPLILETPENGVSHKDDIRIIKQWFDI